MFEHVSGVESSGFEHAVVRLAAFVGVLVSRWLANRVPGQGKSKALRVVLEGVFTGLILVAGHCDLEFPLM